MFKKFFIKFLKVMFILFFFVFLVGVIGFGVAYFFSRRDLNNINDLYSEVQNNLNRNKQESQLNIDNLQSSFDDLNKEITSLKKENQDLKDSLVDVQKNGYGEILGKILPFVTSDSSFSQYQLVCAENTNNKNLQYCVTAAAISQDYNLILPAGTYHVSARIVSPDNKITNQITYYSEYIKCIQEKKAAECDTKLSANILNVLVESGKTTANIDPIGWTIQ